MPIKDGRAACKDILQIYRAKANKAKLMPQRETDWVKDLYTLFLSFRKNQYGKPLFAHKLFELFKELNTKVRLMAMDSLDRPLIFAYST